MREIEDICSKIGKSPEERKFVRLMEILSNAYITDTVITRDNINVWYAYLKDYAISDIEDAVDNWIINHELLPSISQLIILIKAHNYVRLWNDYDDDRR